MYIRFNQNLDVKSYISVKIEAVKRLLAVFAANCGTAPTSTQTVKSCVYFVVIDAAWHDVVIGM